MSIRSWYLARQGIPLSGILLKARQGAVLILAAIIIIIVVLVIYMYTHIYTYIYTYMCVYVHRYALFVFSFLLLLSAVLPNKLGGGSFFLLLSQAWAKHTSRA